MNTEQYLAVSSLAYKDLSNYVGLTIGQLSSDRGPLDNAFMSRIENRQLNSLSSWILINAHTSPSGMSAIAVQNPETKEIVFAYRGTDIDRGVGDAVKDLLTDAAIASSGNLIVKDGINQFQDAFNFYINTVKKAGGASNIGTRSFTGHSLGGGLAQYMA